MKHWTPTNLDVTERTGCNLPRAANPNAVTYWDQVTCQACLDSPAYREHLRIDAILADYQKRERESLTESDRERAGRVLNELLRMAPALSAEPPDKPVAWHMVVESLADEFQAVRAAERARLNRTGE